MTITSELELFYNLKEAFETSTPSCNRFFEALNRIKWDYIFFADEEHYFLKDGFTFTTPSLEPFKITKDWRPTGQFSDGCSIEF